MTSRPNEILVVGNYCHDTIITKDGSMFQGLGGSPAYISAILSALGVQYEVIAKVGEDFRYMEQTPKKPRVASGTATTAFLDDWRKGERIETLQAQGTPIFAEDINTSAEIAICCGVMDEIKPETITAMRKNSKKLLCDMQGLIRMAGDTGKVTYMPLEVTKHFSILNQIDYLKASAVEAKLLNISAIRQKTNLIVTEGPQGCTVYTRDGSFTVPGLPVKEKDSTGAGDSFLAGFAYGLLKGFDLKKAAKFANFCGAVAVTQLGVPEISPDTFEAFVP